MNDSDSTKCDFSPPGTRIIAIKYQQETVQYLSRITTPRDYLWKLKLYPKSFTSKRLRGSVSGFPSTV